MAAVTMTGITLENPTTANTFNVVKIAAHDVGDVVQASGAISAAVGDAVGIIIAVGDKESVVLVQGTVSGVGTNGAANAGYWSAGDGTVVDAEPAGAAGTGVVLVGTGITAGRALINFDFYEKGA